MDASPFPLAGKTPINPIHIYQNGPGRIRDEIEIRSTAAGRKNCRCRRHLKIGNRAALRNSQRLLEVSNSDENSDAAEPDVVFGSTEYWIIAVPLPAEGEM